MKVIKTICRMMRTAKNRYEANPTKPGYAYMRRFGNDVYSLHYDKSYVHLYHYGTLTLKFSLMENRIAYYYGESISDRDSMNTALYALDYDAEFFRYSKYKDGVYLTTE
ncbi:terminal repeat-encoded protein P_gp299 [Bacillus phage vB_BceM_WH1]|nr:terminal repeat-encoded protein P_gp299 [Bacillus phage vB_BceM_WH1]